MSTSAAKTRLSNVEGLLTPQQWAIRIVDAIRRHPSLGDFTVAEIRAGSSMIHEAQAALVKKVEAMYSGRKEYTERRAAMKHTSIAFETLKNLIFGVNSTVDSRTGRARTEVALKLQTLQTIILRDAFGRTADHAATWIKSKAGRGSKDAAHQAQLLGELAAYADQGNDIAFLSTAEMWADSIQALAFDLIYHKAAIAQIQDAYFDGHEILAVDIEEDLDSAIEIVRQAAAQYNEYRTARNKHDSHARIDLKAISIPYKGAKRLADHWLTPAQDEAILDVLNWMCEVSKRDAHRRKLGARLAEQAA